MIPLYSLRSLAVRHAAASDDSRYNLCGVRFEADGSCVATNGHVLMHADEGERPNPEEFPGAAATISEGELEPFTLPAPSCDALVKALKAVAKRSLPICRYAALQRKSNGDAESEWADFSVTDLETTSHTRGRKIEGEFVNWHMVADPLEDKTPKTCVILDSAYLAVMLKAAGEFSSASRKLVKIETFGEKDPVRFTVEDLGGTLRSWIMPCREA